MNHPIPRIFYLFSATIVLALDADVSAADVDGGRNWPQWRGETGYGVSSETSLSHHVERRLEHRLDR